MSTTIGQPDLELPDKEATMLHSMLEETKEERQGRKQTRTKMLNVSTVIRRDTERVIVG